MKKKILFVTRRAPYGTGLSREALDALLAASAYEQDVALLFMDDGVFQLQPGQDPGDIDAKNLGSTLPVLPMYDVEDIYVQKTALAARGMDINALLLPAKSLANTEIEQLLESQDVILSF